MDSVWNYNFNINRNTLKMKDLIDFNRFQIEALQTEVCKLRKQNNALASYCFEALEKEITEEYKIIIKQLIYELLNDK